MKSNKYHVFFNTPSFHGEITITQTTFTPIDETVLDDVRRIIREKNNLPADTPVVIVCWQRYESDGGEA